MEYYVTYWKNCYKTPNKIRQSLQSVYFGQDELKAFAFFYSLDKKKYNANFKGFDNGVVKVLKTTRYNIRKGG